MNWFASFIKDYGLDEFDKMLVEKPNSLETPERKKWFKEQRNDLFEKYDAEYHIMSELRVSDQLKKIDKILYDNREAEEDEESEKRIQALWFGMAAILTEICMKIPNASIMYDTYLVEIHIPSKYRDWVIRPIYIVSQGWIRYHFKMVSMDDFVHRSVFPYLEYYLKDEY